MRSRRISCFIDSSFCCFRRLPPHLNRIFVVVGILLWLQRLLAFSLIHHLKTEKFTEIIEYLLRAPRTTGWCSHPQQRRLRTPIGFLFCANVAIWLPQRTTYSFQFDFLCFRKCHLFQQCQSCLLGSQTLEIASSSLSLARGLYCYLLNCFWSAFAVSNGDDLLHLCFVCLLDSNFFSLAGSCLTFLKVHFCEISTFSNSCSPLSQFAFAVLILTCVFALAQEFLRLRKTAHHLPPQKLLFYAGSSPLRHHK